MCFNYCRKEALLPSVFHNQKFVVCRKNASLEKQSRKVAFQNSLTIYRNLNIGGFDTFCDKFSFDIMVVGCTRYVVKKMKTRCSSERIWIVAVLVLFVCCTKSPKQEHYGVSISAPSVAEASCETFSAQELALLRLSNGWTFDLLGKVCQNDSTFSNIVFSPLLLTEELHACEYERAYVEALFAFCNLEDTSFETIRANFNSIKQRLSEMDSSFAMSSSLDSSDKGGFVVCQSARMGLLREDAAKTSRHTFSPCNGNERLCEFFNLSGSFKTFESENEFATDIPIGNGSCSLLLVRPAGNRIREYVATFSEKQYVEVVKHLEERKLSVRFPDFERFVSKQRLLLPEIQTADTLFHSREVMTDCQFSLFKPTEAVLQSLGKSLEYKILNSEKGETATFDTPFLFFVREIASGAILLAGICCE